MAKPVIMVWWLQLLFALTICQVCDAQYVIVYSNQSFEGESENVYLSACTNVSDVMAGNVSSINTRNQCARLFDDIDCQGESIEVMARSPYHNVLSGWNFENRAMSVSECRSECSPEVTGHFHGKNPVFVTIFTKPDYAGNRSRLEVRGCTELPAGFVDNVNSIETHGECIQLYNNAQCYTKGRNFDSIELRQGTPAHGAVRAWGFATAKAVSHCGYKCDLEVPDRSSARVNEVILFEEGDFQGNLIRLQVTDKCSNLPLEWQANVMSVITHGTGCVRLFDKINCRGDSIEVVRFRENINWGNDLRSFLRCSHHGPKNGSGTSSQDDAGTPQKITSERWSMPEWSKVGLTGSTWAGLFFMALVCTLLSAIVVLVAGKLKFSWRRLEMWRQGGLTPRARANSLNATLTRREERNGGYAYNEDVTL